MVIVELDTFWLLLKIRHKLGVALDRLLWTLQKRRSFDDETNLSAMADGKAVAIRGELAKLLHGDAWADVMADAAGFLDESTVAKLPGMLYRYGMANVANYNRRIIGRTGSADCELLAFARTPPGDTDPRRVELAQHILAYERSPQDLPTSHRKLLLGFARELHHCVASDGRISSCVYAPFKLLRRYWKCDSQEIEGCMNILQNIMRRGPRTSLPVLDARIACRKAIGYEGLNESAWQHEACDSEVRGAAEKNWKKASVFSAIETSIIDDTVAHLGDSFRVSILLFLL